MGGLIGINTAPYTSQTQGQPSPSAPPPSPGPVPRPSSDYFYQRHRTNHCYCNGSHPQPEILSLLIARALNFSRVFTRGFVIFLSIIMFVSTISLLPNTLLYNAAFFLFAAGLGLHLPTLVAGQVLYAVFCCFDPLLLSLLC